MIVCQTSRNNEIRGALDESGGDMTLLAQQSSAPASLRAGSRVRLLAAIVAAALALGGGIAPPGATTVLAHSRAVETVATGLDRPRGLVLLGEHKLAVAEAGHAGPVCVAPGQCTGLNGQVTTLRLDVLGEQDRTVLTSGLASFSGPFAAFGLAWLTLSLDRHVGIDRERRISAERLNSMPGVLTYRRQARA
jgi:hypothetical protein